MVRGQQRMKLYFAHSFAGQDDALLRDSRNSALLNFLRNLREQRTTIVDPAETSVPASDYKRRFSYCLEQIKLCDALVVDATCTLGVGVGAELMFAKLNGLPIFVVCP